MALICELHKSCYYNKYFTNYFNLSYNFSNYLFTLNQVCQRNYADNVLDKIDRQKAQVLTTKGAKEKESEKIYFFK